MKCFFCATSGCFRRHQVTFCPTSDFFFRHKIVIYETLNFCFGHYFLMLCHGDIFLLSRGKKNIITCQKK